MNRTLLLMAVAAVATSGVKAQSVTYNHDSPKQNQITVMETGTGALSPELYYTLLHNKYKKSAASKNKLSFRTLAGVNLYNQTDEAEAIDSALVKRAEIEALNVADRQIDLAWLAEGDKINAQMERFQRNIDRILLAGGTTDDKERWTEYYHVYQCAIDATKDAYMPNAQRKKEYLRIYEDVVRQNEILVVYLARRQNHGHGRIAERNRRPNLGQKQRRQKRHEPLERIAPCGARFTVGRRHWNGRRRRDGKQRELKAYNLWQTEIFFRISVSTSWKRRSTT